MKNGYQETMLDLLERQGEVSAAEFRALMPGLPEQTVFSRIRALERKGLIYECGRGLYAAGRKPLYHSDISPRMRELNALLISEFPDTSLCISSWDGAHILIETDRTEVSRMALFLRGRYPGVFSYKEAGSSAGNLPESIIVKPLITDAPLLPAEGFSTPSLEKSLVDIIADRILFGMDAAALRKEYQRAFEVYPLNRSRILRYAGRRGVGDEVREQIGKVDMARVGTIAKIQNLLSGQPIDRAWLFGSWSRMEERPDSDIDILVDFSGNAHVSLLQHIGFQQDMEDAIGRQIDLVTNGTLLPFAERTANRDKYLIYERSA